MSAEHTRAMQVFRGVADSRLCVGPLVPLAVCCSHQRHSFFPSTYQLLASAPPCARALLACPGCCTAHTYPRAMAWAHCMHAGWTLQADLATVKRLLMRRNQHSRL